MFETPEGLTSLVNILQPIINYAVMHHVSQPFYSTPESSYFTKCTSISPPTQQTPQPTPKQTKEKGKPEQKVVEYKLEEDLPPGIPLTSLHFASELLNQHPLLPLLFNTEYVQKVIETVKERLHMVGEIQSLCLPFFTEPSFATTEVVELRNKIWKPSMEPHANAIYSIFLLSFNQCYLTKADKLKDIPEDKWNHSTIYDTVKEYAKKRPEGEPQVPGGVGGLFNALRLLVMGSPIGAGVPHSLATLGRAVVLRRLEKGLGLQPANHLTNA